MVKAKTVECENKEKDEMTDAAKADVEKTVEEKDDAKLVENAVTSNYQVKESTEFPLPSSSLFVSFGFGTHFLNLSFDVSLTGVLKDSAKAEISSLIIVISNKKLHTLSPPHVTPTISIVQQTTTPIPTPSITTKAPTITTFVPESDALTAIQLRVAKLEKDVSELKKIDHYAESLASLKS
ncbi:hypothetical protein Tco_0970196 [Tanacetum coccineum]